MAKLIDNEDEETEDEEDLEIEVTEISLTEDEINFWIGQLVELKETKEETTLVLDNKNEILITYNEGLEEEEKDEDVEEDIDEEDEEEDDKEEEEEKDG
jgi:hypothetical protein